MSGRGWRSYFIRYYSCISANSGKLKFEFENGLMKFYSLQLFSSRPGIYQIHLHFNFQFFKRIHLFAKWNGFKKGLFKELIPHRGKPFYILLTSNNMKNKLDRVSRSVKLRVNEEELLYKSMKNDFSMIDSMTKSNTLWKVSRIFTKRQTVYRQMCTCRIERRGR